MSMTLGETFITIVMILIGTMITRFLPFVIFPSNKTSPPYIQFLGRVLPYAVVGLLIIYCLKDISFVNFSHGIPEAIAIAIIVLLHHWKHNTLLSICGGTLIYMILVQLVFV